MLWVSHFICNNKKVQKRIKKTKGKGDFLVSKIGLERFLCRGIYISHFPLTGWQYFTKKVLTHTVETSFKDCCKEIFLSSIVVYCKYISIEPSMVIIN